MRPDVGELTAAIERIARPDEYERLAAGALATRDEWSWQRTTAAYGRLIEQAAAAPAGGAA